MKRTLILSLGLALFAPLALVGCGEEAKKETVTKDVTPTGSKTETVTDKVKVTGDGAAK